MALFKHHTLNYTINNQFRRSTCTPPHGRWSIWSQNTWSGHLKVLVKTQRGHLMSCCSSSALSVVCSEMLFCSPQLNNFNSGYCSFPISFTLWSHLSIGNVSSFALVLIFITCLCLAKENMFYILAFMFCYYVFCYYVFFFFTFPFFLTLSFFVCMCACVRLKLSWHCYFTPACVWKCHLYPQRVESPLELIRGLCVLIRP